MDEYPLNRSEPDTSVNAGRQGRSNFPEGRLGPVYELATTCPHGTARDRFRTVVLLSASLLGVVHP